MPRARWQVCRGAKRGGPQQGSNCTTTQTALLLKLHYYSIVNIYPIVNIILVDEAAQADGGFLQLGLAAGVAMVVVAVVAVVAAAAAAEVGLHRSEPLPGSRRYLQKPGHSDQNFTGVALY